jgi:stearoyl-CoA desaturase (delta-9 desaturase)
MDYRNAIKWYQYDPTKWLIWIFQKLGLASHLRVCLSCPASNTSAYAPLQVFPDNEVRKGQFTMQLKRLRETQESLVWPPDSNDLPVINWQSCMHPSPTSQRQHANRYSRPIAVPGTSINIDFGLHP